MPKPANIAPLPAAAASSRKSPAITCDDPLSPAAPKNLSAESKRWWREIQEEYSIADSAGLLLLRTALESLDRLRQAQKIVKREGMTLPDRFGQAKSHPLLVTERDARSAMLAALKALNLDIEPLHDRPGRPGGT